MRSRKRVVKKPLHIQVAEILRQEILNRGQPGQRLDSESKLAQRFGVSLLTLRHGVGALAHEGLVERRQGSGTYVADVNAKRHVAILHLANERIPDASFQLRVFHMLGAIFQQRGFRYRFYVWTHTPQGMVCLDFVEDASRDRVCGAVFVAMAPEPALPVLQKKKIPYVLTSAAGPAGVAIDYPGIARDGARYLVERGCRKIALMRWGDAGLCGTPEPSIAAFRRVLVAGGLPCHEGWLRPSVPPNVPGAGWEAFREIWTARADKPDGLVVTDDILFRDVAIGILDSGIKVPGQLQVVAHANKGSGITYPFPVVSLEIDLQEYAQALADLLIQLMRSETVSPTVRSVHARLVRPADAPAPRASAATVAR